MTTTETTGARPLLLLDVDGPLNPYSTNGARPDGYTTHRLGGFQVWLNPDHGPALSALDYELVWATSWEDEANASIAPVIGLPQLPVILWPGDAGILDLCFKTPMIVKWAQGRPFAWVDDEITDVDREYVDRHHDGGALLHRVDPRKGLRGEDFEALAAWAGALA